MANPVLAEVVRGNWVENRHRGAFCVSNADGDILASAGDIDRAIFPRSAIKSLQALAMFKSGAAQEYPFTSPELAMTCASHHGQDVHVQTVSGMLDKLGLGVEDLECGAHPPTNPEARKAWRETGDKPTALFNNCSGKHAGMLAVAKALGAPTKDYVTRDHPVQKLVRRCVEEIIGADLTEDKCGTDGCSIPTWAAPLQNFAQGFAKMATGEGLDAGTAAASRTIFDAATSNPLLIAGTDTLDTDVMKAFGGNLMLKIGAEGVFCGAVRDKGIGFALKVDDGHMKAAEAMVSALIAEIAEPDAEQRKVLNARTNQVMHNWRGIEVAEMRATDAIQAVFS